MARLVLGEHRDDGRASYQISVTVCSTCGAGQQRAGGELIPVGADIVAMANCDGQHLGHIAPLAANENAVPAAVRTDEADSATARHLPWGASPGAIPHADGAHAHATPDHASATPDHAHGGATLLIKKDASGRVHFYHGDGTRTVKRVS
jgi:hypothetical protein